MRKLKTIVFCALLLNLAACGGSYDDESDGQPQAPAAAGGPPSPTVHSFQIGGDAAHPALRNKEGSTGPVRDTMINVEVGDHVEIRPAGLIHEQRKVVPPFVSHQDNNVCVQTVQVCALNRELVRAIADTFPTKVQRIYELNKAILSYSKELSKPLELNLVDTELVEFLNSVLDEYRPQPLLQGIALSLQSDESSLTRRIDPMQFRRVVRNLIRNAAEACIGRSDSRIEVIVRSNIMRRGVAIIVKDNGRGISSQIRDRLFQPFETFGKEHGTGLGLAMSRRLVDAHGGTLELITSQSGASFQVTLT